MTEQQQHPFADDILPSYEHATLRDPISLFSPYLRLEDVYNCSLVSQQWHNGVENILWGQPDHFWDLGERNALVGFQKFIDVFPIARFKARSKVHTLSLEKVNTSIYTSLSRSWLKDLFILLPNLRILSLPSFPLFDHPALLSKPSIEWKGDVDDVGNGSSSGLPHNSLKYLDISNLSNTTAKSLVELFTNITPALEVLNVSGTNGVNHPDTIVAIGKNLMSLTTLKMRSLKLTDKALELLVQCFGLQLVKLDLTENMLTDASATTLLDYSFMPPSYEIDESPQALAGETSDGEPDFGSSEEWTTTQTIVRRHGQDRENIEDFTRHPTRLPPPDIYGQQQSTNLQVAKGLIHLYISKNRFTADGIIMLLKSGRLKTFDCGKITTSVARETETDSESFRDITTALKLYAFRSLRSLRIDHRIVCGGVGHAYNETRLLSNPSLLPRLKHLILVGLPTLTHDPSITRNLFTYIDNQTPLPPHEEYEIFNNTTTKRANRSLTLEMNNTMSDEDQTDVHVGMFSSDITRSTYDDDTAALHEASASDFSFFGEVEGKKEMTGQEVESGNKGWYRDVRSTRSTMPTSPMAQGPQSKAKTIGNDDDDDDGGSVIDVADEIQKWMHTYEERGDGRKGLAIRIVQDFGGRESIERGVEGNRWGHVRIAFKV